MGEFCPGISYKDVVFDTATKMLDNKVYDSKKEDSLSFTNLKSSICACLKVAPKASIQKRVLRAVLVKGTDDRIVAMESKRLFVASVPLISLSQLMQ